MVTSLIALAAAAAAIVIVVTKKLPPSASRATVGAVATASPPPGATPATGAQPASIAVTIRTIPDGARVQLDGRDVSNPFAQTLPSDGTKHTVTATLAGFVKATQVVGFDRDRPLVLTLAPDGAGALRSAPANSRRRASAHAKSTESTEAGYRGSNLNIETEFPGPK